MRNYYKLLEALEGPELQYRRLAKEKAELRISLEDLAMRPRCCIGDPSLPEAYDTAARKISIVYWKMVELKSKFPNLEEIQ